MILLSDPNVEMINIFLNKFYYHECFCYQVKLQREDKRSTQFLSVALRILSISDISMSSCPLAWITLWTPTKALLRVSKLEEYNTFFLIAAESGHQQSRNIFDLLWASAPCGANLYS